MQASSNMGYDIHFNDALGAYMHDNMPPMPDILKRLKDETEALGPVARMQISWIQARFMQSLVRLTAAKTIVEIGTFTGMSSLVMAMALPGDGRIITHDISEEWTRIAKRYWLEADMADKIELRLGDGIEGLRTMLNDGKAGTVDLVFLDADKKGLADYLDLSHQLLRQGGAVLVDNVLWHGDVIDPNNQKNSTRTIRDLNAALKIDDRFFTSMVPVGDGITIAIKN